MFFKNTKKNKQRYLKFVGIEYGICFINKTIYKFFSGKFL